ncbi:MAG: hypothetical protein JO031_02790 [Ktedonobacteraceae bacterium]|nr:hypothetical protein [Ktedonobacteraceae bacterium]
MLEANTEIANALRAFLKTESRLEARAFLEREKVLLLAEEADQLLCMLIRQVRQNANLEAQNDRAKLLTIYLLLLRKARESDISTAWSWLEQELSSQAV